MPGMPSPKPDKGAGKDNMSSDELDQIQCPICWQINHDPVMLLTCAHIMCFDCATELHAKSVSDGSPAKCPFCRVHFSIREVSRNHASSLRRVVERHVRRQQKKDQKAMEEAEEAAAAEAMAIAMDAAEKLMGTMVMGPRPRSRTTWLALPLIMLVP